MANTRELRRRMKSVKNISQITKAMQMVAATKMRKAQTQAISGRPYNETLNFALQQISGRVDPSTHAFLKPNGSSKTGVIVLTTDKSLCGALNTNVFRAIQTFLNTSRSEKKGSDYGFYTVGKKGRDFLVRTGRNLEADFENTELVTFSQATQIARLIIPAFLKGEVGEVYLIYPNFISTLRQEPKIVKLLPVSKEDLFLEYGLEEKSTKKTTLSDKQLNTEFLFEPDLSSLLDFVLNHYIESKIYQGLLETKASEHSARMMAMQNATDNAKELVGDLTLAYNQTRQESITRELLEITTAGLALE